MSPRKGKEKPTCSCQQGELYFVCTNQFALTVALEGEKGTSFSFERGDWVGAKGKVATGIVHLQEGERRWKTSALLKTGSQPASPAAQHCCSLTHSPAALPEQRVDCVDLSRQRQREKQRQSHTITVQCQWGPPRLV